MAKPKPPVEAVVDTAVHPLFARLREEAGFAEFSGATLEAMLEAPGLKMVLFAEDPNLRRETLDIAVIGPELRKALGAAVASGWYTARDFAGIHGRLRGQGPRRTLRHPQVSRRRALQGRGVPRRRRGTDGLGRIHSGARRDRVP